MDDLVHRSRRAKEIVDNEEFKASMAAMRDAYIAGALRCDVRDDLGRFRFIEGLRMVEEFKNHLSMVVQTGEVAEAELKRLERIPTPIERVVRLF